MKPPRGLSGEEAALWARVAATVKPLRPVRNQVADASPVDDVVMARPQQRSVQRKIATPRPQPAAPPLPREQTVATRHGLDSTWDRKLAKGIISPEFTIDLHGHTLDTAWSRLEHGLMLAENQGARVVLVVTGRPRPVDRGAAQTGPQRGVIRAKLLDWLAAGSHAARIAAVRSAHPRHGGAGALYLVLRRR